MNEAVESGAFAIVLGLAGLFMPATLAQVHADNGKPTNIRRLRWGGAAMAGLGLLLLLVGLAPDDRASLRSAPPESVYQHQPGK